MAVRTHTFNGVRYDIDVSGDFDGVCESPAQKTPSIYVIADLNTLKGLRVLLEECLHAEGWKTDHEVVKRTASESARLLWRLGYRRTK